MARVDGEFELSLDERSFHLEEAKEEENVGNSFLERAPKRDLTFQNMLKPWNGDDSEVPVEEYLRKFEHPHLQLRSYESIQS